MKGMSCSLDRSIFGTFLVILLSFLVLSLLVQSSRLNQNVLAQAAGMNQRGTVEIYSEIGITASFQTGIEVSVLLQVARDERGTSLFFVEVLNNDSKKDAEHNISL